MTAWPPSEELSKLTRDPKLLYVFVVGPGEGEAFAVALPNAAGWLLGDGCRTSSGSSGLVEVLDQYRAAHEPILAYVLTHPHLDHARGIVELCEKYQDAIKLVAVTPPWEFGDVAAGSTSARIVAKQVEKGLERLRKLGNAKRVDLVAGAKLPLAAGVTADILTPPRTHSMTDPNDASAAIVINHGATRILLGSDLPTNTPAGSGWSGILTAAPHHADALVLKIPHHCSASSHCPDVFPVHQQARAWAATPFNGNDLPNLVELAGMHWILARGSPVHLTAPPVSKHVQVPAAHPARMPLSSLRSRVELKPTGIPLIDSGAVETTPVRATHARDSLWCFAVDAAGALVGRWRGRAALEITP